MAKNKNMLTSYVLFHLPLTDALHFFELALAAVRWRGALCLGEKALCNEATSSWKS